MKKFLSTRSDGERPSGGCAIARRSVHPLEHCTMLTDIPYDARNSNAQAQVL